jgi:lipoate-protein ligase A
VPLLGRVYDQLVGRHKQGLAVNLSVLADISPEEMSHLVRITQSQQGTVNEDAFRDCIRTLRKAAQMKNISTDDDLRAFRNKLKESKGTKQ